MIPPEMFIKVEDAETRNPMWLHIVSIDCLKHIDEDRYSVYLAGVHHEIIVEGGLKKNFPFLFSDVK